MTELTSGRQVASTTPRRGTGSVGISMPKSFNDDELREIRSFHTALGVFRQVRRDMPLQYVLTLLLVATDEGKTVTEYARMTGTSASVMSRHLLDIGERNRHMEDGFGLVMYKANPTNLREHQYYLTPKGRATIQQAIRSMRK